jgi:hypothetical protein
VKRHVQTKCLSLLAALSAAGFAAASANAAGPHWRFGGANLIAGQEREVAVGLVNPLEIEFEGGMVLYTVSCSALMAGEVLLGKIIGGAPGKDQINGVQVAVNPVLCRVLEGGVLSTRCGVKEIDLVNPSNSTLGGTSPNFTDTFASFELNVELIGINLLTCPASGLYTLQGSLTGKWHNVGSKISFAKVPITKFGAFTNLSFSAEYSVRGTNRLRSRIGVKGEQPDWFVEEALLGSGVEDEALYEGGAVELKNEAMTIKCGAITGLGTITGGEPGKGKTTVELGSCSDVGASKCAVEEPIQAKNVNSTLDVLNKAKEEYGDKFESFAATVVLSGSECASAGSYKVEGNLVGLENNSTEELEFTATAQEGSTLKLGGKAATLVGKAKTELASPFETEEETEKERKEREAKEKEEKEKEEEKGLPEFLPGSGSYTATSGKSTLETKAKSSIECSSSADEGSLSGVKKGTITMDFKGCKASGLAARSLGDASESILLHGATTLCYINKSTKKVGMLIEMPSGGLHVEVSTLGTLLLITGAVIGTIEPVNTSKTGPYKIKFKETAGVQEVTKCEGGSEEILKTSVNGGAAEQSGESTEVELTFKAAHEVMA